MFCFAKTHTRNYCFETQERVDLKTEVYEQREDILALKLEMARTQWEQQSIARYCHRRDQTVYSLLSKSLSKKARRQALEVLQATSLEQ